MRPAARHTARPTAGARATLFLLALAAGALRLAAAAAAGHDAARARGGGAAGAAEAGLLRWLEEEGAEVNFRIEARGGARGTYAAAAVPPGGVVAKIPLTAAYWFPHDYASVRELAARLLREAAAPGGSRFAPHFETLPLPLRAPAPGGGGARAVEASEVSGALGALLLHPEVFPGEYLHLLGSAKQALHIANTQRDTLMFWAEHGLELAGLGYTLADLRAATLMVSTRFMSVDHRGRSYPIMVPGLDMANHDSSCTNWYEFRPCAAPPLPWPRASWDPAGIQSEADAAERQDLCAWWITGAGLEAGQEVCLSYGYLTPDQAVFQYGFVLKDEPPHLARMDRPPAPHAGADEQPDLVAELHRVAALAAALARTAPDAAAARPAPADARGTALGALLELRGQRARALAAEAERLLGLSGGMGVAAAAPEAAPELELAPEGGAGGLEL
ncbi:MAG: hypothetical protein J3K34DRAFT_516470 [Monoraphidium minutum]|nr:MAG: hypothetical protein J3K34DRAFT_516470 [Monoraphidium minutum]